MKNLLQIVTASLLIVFSSFALASDGVGGQPAGIAKMPMIMEKASPFASAEETVAQIKANVAKISPWVVSEVSPLHKSIEKHGGPATRPTYLVNVCNPLHSSAMLANDEDMWSSVLMPCTVSVYEKSNGKPYIAYMNARMIGMMFGGKIAEVMGGPVAEAQDKFLNFK